MNAREKGKGKKKPASRWTAKKIGIIIIGVGFAVIMVVSSLGMGWLMHLNPATSGDGAVVGVTLYDGMDRPVLTTSHRTFNTTFDAGDMIWLCGQFAMRVNGTSQNELIPVPVYNYYYGEAKYALFSPEWDTISRELQGMKQGETRKIYFPAIQGFERDMTAEEFDGIGGNYSTATTGQQIVLAFAENPTISLEENVTPSYVIRTGYVTGKTTEGVRVNYAYPVAEISLIQVTKA
ncbi:MAG: hypothetical protein MUC66_05155 [Methanolinea sp.]|jgi:hypothetical protein|nr:hypothetical protein [Methanolinea sp.]